MTLILKDKVVIKNVCHFVDYYVGVEISSKERDEQKKKGRVLEVVLPGRGQMSYLGEGRICLGDQG